MKMKKSVTGVMVALMICALIVPTACAGAKFELSSLEITPTKVGTGQPATIAVEVANTGVAEGTYTATLKIDGETVDSKEVTIDAEGKETVSFRYSTKSVGSHTVELNGLVGSLEVIPFKIGSLEVRPITVAVGDEVTVNADIENAGEIEGTYTATLTLEGDVSQTKELTLGAGATETVVFTLATSTAGTYHLGLDGLTATLTVLEPSPSGPAEVSITSNRVVADFPDTIAFSLDGSSALPVTSINLEYGTDKRSLVSEVSRVEPEYGPGVRIRASWVWQMKKTGSLPPGAKVWWRWRITDEVDRTYVTPRQTIVFDDTRYQWHIETIAALDIYWHSLGTTLAKELTEGVESRLSRVKLEVSIPEERKPKVFVYESSEQLRSAVLFTQEWTGALAYWDYNIILIPARSDNLEWAKRTLAHEITHLIVREATFGPFGDIPTWLNEGLAQYAEGEMEEYQREVLDSAIKDDRLISVRSLCSDFPADPEEARLAYAQSLSLVSYLVDTYGWDKMRELLRVFKEGSTYDDAVKEVYGFDIDGLEERWRAHIGAY